MFVFTENDFPPVRPQIMRIFSGGEIYDMVPLHMGMDEVYRRKSASRAVEHAHDVYHIVVYNKSDANFSVGGRIVRAEEGLMVLTSPGESHMFQPVGRGWLSYSEFTFSYLSQGGRRLELPFHRLLALYSGIEAVSRDNLMMLTPGQHGAVAALFAKLAGIRRDRTLRRHMDFYGTLSELFHLLLVFSTDACDSPGGAAARDGLERAMEYVHSHYAGKIRVGKLASVAHMSKGHFQRRFKRKFGSTPVEYLNRYRIEVARNLLRSTALACSEIAGKVGMADIFYFSKLFRKATGMSPSHCRKANIR